MTKKFCKQIKNGMKNCLQICTIGQYIPSFSILSDISDDILSEKLSSI